jgi:hypothetical protein
MEIAKAKISALPNNELQRALNSKFKDVHDEIRGAWQSVIKRLSDTPTPSASNSSTPGSRFNDDIQMHAQRIDGYRWLMPPSPARLEQERRWHTEMALRLKKELADVEFRISQGLDRCNQFFDDWQLLAMECRHSRSKSLHLYSDFLKAPLDFYSRALKGNDDVIHIDFYCSDQEHASWFAETIHDLPLVTSIKVLDPQRLPPIQRNTPLFIDDYFHSQSLDTFLIPEQRPIPGPYS